MKVRFAVAPGRAFGRDDLEGMLDVLEPGGFDGIWLSDVTLMSATDPLVGLAFAAGRTERLKLGANIVPLGRNPFLLAKALAQLDRISRGRLLLSVVPGIDQPGERLALGAASADRATILETTVELLRRWWSGEPVTHVAEHWSFDALRLPSLPAQSPLELWLGGRGPKALDRAGRIADGWLGAAVTPREAEPARRQIEASARRAGRKIDPEHFGMSIAYARQTPDQTVLGRVGARRHDVDPLEVVPVGADGLRSMIERFVDAGVSKFVLGPLGEVRWADESRWLSDTVLDMQS